MTTLLAAPRRHLFFATSQLARRAQSTLANNPHIHVFPHPTEPEAHLLTLLPTAPPTPALAIATTTALPPTPDSTAENPHFLTLLHAVLAEHAARDPAVQAQAAAFASNAGASFLAGPRQTRGGGGGASAQGGAGGAGVGGFVHVSDARNPPDWGRIAWPEDIFGSVEVDGAGAFVGGAGAYQASGTYRVCTNQGVLGLSGYMRERVLERLREVEAGMGA